MTSVTKASIAPDNTALVATEVKNAADVTLATNSNSDDIALGYSAVSSNDTHIKTLDDAIVAGDGVTVTETDDGADESLVIAVISLSKMDLLASGTETGNVASVSITGWTPGISEYHKFILEITGLESNAGSADSLDVVLNSDTGANYQFGWDGILDTTQKGNTGVGANAALIAGSVAWTATDPNYFGAVTIEFHRPEDTSDYKFLKYHSAIPSTTAAEYWHVSGSAMWASNAAITTIAFSPNVGNTFEIGGANEPSALDWRLYGVR